VEVLSTSNGLEAAATNRFKAEDLAKVGSLLGRLTALQTLNLDVTQVTDLGPLKGLTTIRTLNLSSTKVRTMTVYSPPAADFGPLKGLTALQTLDLLFTHVADLVPLTSLNALQNLSMYRTQVTDLAPVQDLPNLKVVAGAPDGEKGRFDINRAQKGLPKVSDHFDLIGAWMIGF
jgi:Leucine-rich repeat (LRR) protein